MKEFLVYKVLYGGARNAPSKPDAMLDAVLIKQTQDPSAKNLPRLPQRIDDKARQRGTPQRTRHHSSTHGQMARSVAHQMEHNDKTRLISQEEAGEGRDPLTHAETIHLPKEE